MSFLIFALFLTFNAHQQSIKDWFLTSVYHLTFLCLQTDQNLHIECTIYRVLYVLYILDAGAVICEP